MDGISEATRQLAFAIAATLEARSRDYTEIELSHPATHAAHEKAKEALRDAQVVAYYGRKWHRCRDSKGKPTPIPSWLWPRCVLERLVPRDHEPDALEMLEEMGAQIYRDPNTGKWRAQLDNRADRTTRKITRLHATAREAVLDLHASWVDAGSPPFAPYTEAEGKAIDEWIRQGENETRDGPRPAWPAWPLPLRSEEVRT